MKSLEQNRFQSIKANLATILTSLGISRRVQPCWDHKLSTLRQWVHLASQLPPQKILSFWLSRTTETFPICLNREHFHKYPFTQADGELQSQVSQRDLSKVVIGTMLISVFGQTKQKWLTDVYKDIIQLVSVLWDFKSQQVSRSDVIC